MTMDQWLFWVIAVVLTGAVLMLLVKSLRQDGSSGQAHPDLAVYRDQLAEVERDLARGTLAPDEGARLRVEVSRRLLEADRALRGDMRPLASGGLYAVAGALCVILAGSFWLYYRLGAPGYADLPLSLRLEMAEAYAQTRPSQDEAEAANPPRPAAEAGPEFMALMDKLRAAVAERPQDVDGLTLLVRNESALGNFREAMQAQDQLLAVLGDKATPDQRLMAAQIMVAAAGGYVSPEAEAVLVAVLAAEPQNGMARYLSGLMFAQTGRPDRAFALWQPLLEESQPGAPWVAPILADIEAVAAEAGVPFRMPESAGPSEADVVAAGEMSEADRAAMIGGMVDQLEARLLSEGGPLEDWLKLINALSVLGQPDRGRAALAAGEAALQAPEEVEALRDAAAAAGFAP